MLIIFWNANETFRTEKAKFHTFLVVKSKLCREIDDRMKSGAALALKIAWSFNPSSASYFGGVWKRLIRSSKISLRVMLTQWTLRSAIAQADFFLLILNLWLIIRLEDIEVEVLTPFYFLIGEQVNIYCRTMGPIWKKTVKSPFPVPLAF